MLTGLWNVGIKVPDLERELKFHRDLGNEIVLDETFTIDGDDYRIPLVKMGDKYQHVGERMVYEDELGLDLPYGPVHLVYLSDDFDSDVATCIQAGAVAIREPIKISAGFGDREVAFFKAPGGWIFEIAKIYAHRVPEVV